MRGFFANSIFKYMKPQPKTTTTAPRFWTFFT